MENAEALRHALQKLATRRAALGSRLQRDRASLARVEAETQELADRKETLAKGIRKTEVAFERIDETITQTEEGYHQVLDTAQTLMDVVALQRPDLEGEVGAT